MWKWSSLAFSRSRSGGCLSGAERVSGTRNRAASRGIVVALTAALLHAFVLGTVAAAATGEVGVGDKLHLDVFGDPKFGGDFTVDTDGTIAVPWYGRIEVKGLTPAKIEQLLAERLRAAYLPDPKLSVSVATYSAFSVLGDVKNPGRYAYAPGMTLLDAVAAGGGFRRSEGQVGALARARETYEVQLSNYHAALARQARLLAERDGADEIAFPDELTRAKTPAAQLLIDSNRSLFAERAQSLAEQVAGLQKQKEALSEQIIFGNSLIEAKKTQQKLIAAQLGDVDILASKGLATRSSVLLLQRTAAALEGDRLQTMITISHARQEIAKADNSIVERRNDRKAEVLQQLAETTERIAELRIRMRSAAEVLAEEEALAGEPGLPPSERRPTQQIREARFFVLRGGAGSAPVEAEGHAQLLPGDVVTIELPHGEVEGAGATLNGVAASADRPGIVRNRPPAARAPSLRSIRHHPPQTGG